MRYELWTIVPNNCVVHVFDLVGKEKEAHAKGGRMVGEHARFKASLGNGTFVSPSRIEKLGTDSGEGSQPEKSHKGTAKPIGTKVSGKN